MKVNKIIGKKYNVMIDKLTDTWDQISFWTHSTDVEMESGENLQEKFDDSDTKFAALKKFTEDLKAAFDTFKTNAHTLIVTGASRISTSSTDGTGVGVGSATQPTYFKDGRPVACTSYANASVKEAGKLTTGTTGGSTTPIYFENGVPKACTSYGSASVNYANSAGKINSHPNVGGDTTPVYFSNGVPVACSTNQMSVNYADSAHNATYADLDNIGRSLSTLLSEVPETINHGLTLSGGIDVNGEAHISNSIYANGTIIASQPIIQANGKSLTAYATDGYLRDLVILNDRNNCHLFPGSYDNPSSMGMSIISGNGLRLRCHADVIEAEKQIKVDSDKRLKKNIKDIDSSLLTVFDSIRPVSFNWKTDDDFAPKKLGVIAQEVIDALKNVGISEDEYLITCKSNNSEAEENYYGVAYDALQMITLAVVQNQKKQIAELQDEVSTLKNDIAELKALINK